MARRRMAFYVYIVASQRNGTIYIGMTDDLAKRIYEHKTKAQPGFTATYGCDRLVWYETHDTRESAFQRERRLKDWRRSWKLLLIEADNPTWDDLYETLNG
jgi:putative endonuclease